MGRLSSIFSAVLVFVFCAAAAHAQIGRVSGVIKSEDGQPLKGVTVSAENTDIGQSYTATTDDKGRFTIIGLRAGAWRFVAQAPGYAPEAGAMNVRMGAPNPPITFVLKRTGEAAFGALGGISNRDIQSALEAADALMAQQKFDQAIDAYKSLAAKSPALSFVNLQVAAAYRQKNDYDAALAAYRAVLAGDPSNARAHIGIAAVHEARGDARAAEESLLAVASAPGASRDVIYALAELKQAHQASDAADWYRKAAEADPSWGKPRYKLGLFAMEQGNSADAARLLGEVIAIDPTSPEAALAKSSLESLNK